jgi:hypothetical protein
MLDGIYTKFKILREFVIQIPKISFWWGLQAYLQQNVGG